MLRFGLDNKDGFSLCLLANDVEGGLTERSEGNSDILAPPSWSRKIDKLPKESDGSCLFALARAAGPERDQSA